MWLPSFFIGGRNRVLDTGMTLVQFFEFLGFQRCFWSGKWCQITGAFWSQHTVLMYWMPPSDTASHPRGMGGSSYPILFLDRLLIFSCWTNYLLVSDCLSQNPSLIPVLTMSHKSICCFCLPWGFICEASQPHFYVHLMFRNWIV